MQPDTAEDKEKTKRKNGSGLSTREVVMVAGVFFFPFVSFFIIVLIYFFGIDFFRNAPVDYDLIPVIHWLPFITWGFLGVITLLMWIRVMRRMLAIILVFLVQVVGIVGVAVVLWVLATIYGHTVSDSILIGDTAYVLTEPSFRLELFACPNYICYGDTIIGWDSNSYTGSLELVNDSFLKILIRDRERSIYCLPLENLETQIRLQQVSLPSSAVPCPPSP